jgi:ATP:ADP antiporter, AAA family
LRQTRIRWTNDLLGRTFAGRAFVTLFLILAAHSMTETARDALFLSRLPATELPWMYLLVGVASVLAAQANAGLGPGQSALPALLLAAVAISGAFWVAGNSGSPLFLYVLYLWPAVFSSVVVVEFWRIVSDAYTITEAKGIFARLGAGGTAGALVGSGMAVVLSARLRTADLFLAAGVVLATAVFFCPRSPAMTIEPAPERPSQSRLAALSFVGSNRYLRGVAVCLFLATITATLADFVFKSVVTRDLSPERLGRVFAGVSFAVNAGALLLQMTLVRPLLRRLGVTRALTVLPSALSLAAAGLIAGAGVVGALILRVTDGTLRFSVHRAVSDLLYVPLTPGVRARTKALIDVVSQRGGQVAASVVILVGLTIGSGYRSFAAAIVLLGLAIVVVAIRLRQPYLDLFRTTLEKEGTRTRLAYPSLDVESLSSLITAFSSDDEREVVAAMDLVASQREVRAIPVVMLFHPSHVVVLHALDLFEEHQRQGFLWALDRLRGNAEDPQIRAAALSAYARQRGDPAALRAGLADESEVVRVTALVGLVSAGSLTGHDAEIQLAEAVASASVVGRKSLARAIRSQPSPLFEETLVRLADTADSGVRAQVAEAMGRMPSPQFLSPLRSMLSDSSLRDVARRTLVLAGSPALRFLAASLDDEALPRGIRIHLPRSISRFAPRDAMAVLWQRLLVEPDEAIRFKILRGVGRLVAEDPDVRPSEDAIAGAIHDVSRAGLRFAAWRAKLGAQAAARPPSDTEALLIQFLADKQSRATESIFRLLGLSRMTEDFERMFRGLHGSRTDRASGHELVENVVPPAERDTVLALIDDPVDPARLARLVDAEASTTLTYEQTITAIIRSSTGALRTIAARRAGEIGLVPAR